MKSLSNEILFELSPLSNNDCLYVIERIKTGFDFPIHKHVEFELNYIENASGSMRIVGDSMEEIEDYELVLIAGEKLEHAWVNHNCKSNNIREITIQFSLSMFDGLLNKSQFISIKELLDSAYRGVSFPFATILKVRTLLNSMTSDTKGFYSVITFMTIIYELSQCKEMRVLSSSSFAKNIPSTEDIRIKKIEAFIHKNCHREVKLSEVSELINMNPVSFSKFFKLASGKLFTDYVAEIRVGNVIRMLVDSDKTIAEIGYECGFNNLSNFNRIFKAKKGCSPKEFRDIYKKKKIIL